MSIGIVKIPKSIKMPSSDVGSKVSVVSVVTVPQPCFSARKVCGLPFLRLTFAVSRPRGEPSTEITVPFSREFTLTVSLVPLMTVEQPLKSMAAVTRQIFNLIVCPVDFWFLCFCLTSKVCRRLN